MDFNLGCIHEKIVSYEKYDTPFEVACKLDKNNNCKDCPYYYSREDYEADMADDQYDKYIEERFDF